MRNVRSYTRESVIGMWEVISEIMVKQKISQYELAKRMKVSRGTITELKKGRIKKPSFELACKIADALGVSLDELREENRNGV